MAHIQHLARKRPTVRFFGTECQIADMAHDTLERQRVEDENGMLRAEIADLKRSLSESIQGQHATALRLAELMEREPALVAAIERSESAHRYTLKTMRMAQSRINYLHGVIKAHGDEIQRRLAEVEAAHRYPLKTLEMTQSYFDYLQGAVKAERRPAEIEAQAARSIESLTEVDSE